jgi:hypothetical protein
MNMRIGKIKIKPEDLKKEPKEPMWINPFARKDCDCVECSAVIKWDAWCLHNVNNELKGQRLIDSVSELNGWENE